MWFRTLTVIWLRWLDGLPTSGTIFQSCLTRTCPIRTCNISTSMVVIATGNGMDSPGIEFSRPNPRPLQPPVKAVPGSIPGVKRQERDAAHPPPCSAGLQMDWLYISPSPLRLPRHATGLPLLSISVLKIINPASHLLYPKYRTTSRSNTISEHHKNITSLLGTWTAKHYKLAVRE